MSKRFNLLVIFLIVIALAGLPVFLAVRAALKGSGSIESLMKNGVEQYKGRLPIEMDDYITLTNIDWEERQFIYDFDVKVSPEKLMKMQDYFQRKSQFNYCHLENYISFQTYSIQTIERYNAEGHDGPLFSIVANAKPCTTYKTTADGYMMTPDVAQQRRLNAEYLSFFLPIKISDSLSIVSLNPLPHGMVEHNSRGADLVGMADVVGAEILEEFCEVGGNGQYDIYVKPSDTIDPIFAFTLSDSICQSGTPNFKYLSESDIRSLKLVREMFSRK